MRRQSSCGLVVVLLATALGTAGCPLVDAGRQVARERFKLDVMTLNIAAALPEYSSNPTIVLPWRVRYDRIADGFKASQVHPDVIALQEVTARKEWVGNREPEEYESLHYLISKLRDSVGVGYRIAYLGAADSNHPGLVAGQAVLYNEARLKNVTGAPADRVQDGRSRPTVLGVNPRRSYPCEYPAPEFADWCPVLDGDGVYWTSVFADPGGANHFESGFVRFAFVADEQSQFNFYNVHLHPEVPGSVAAATDLVMSMEDLRFTGTVYPPIITGDFNGGTEAFPTFQELASGSPPDFIDFVIAGTAPAHPATYAAKSVGRAMLPGPAPNPDGICAPRDLAWSDHCALLATIEPAV